jgi:hypothetical protein
VVRVRPQHQNVDDQPAEDAERAPAENLANEDRSGAAPGRGTAADGESDEDGEQDHGDAVVEQRFAIDHRFQILRQADLRQDRYGRDRIGCGDQRPEQQGLRECDGHAEERKAGISHSAGQQTRHRGAGECQRQNQPPLLVQTRPADADAAAEQHETEHALQQRFVQVERLRKLAQQIDRAGRNENFQHPQPQRRQHRQQQQADVRLQSQVAIVDEAEDRSDAEQACDRCEDLHPFSSPVRRVPFWQRKSRLIDSSAAATRCER